MIVKADLCIVEIINFCAKIRDFEETSKFSTDFIPFLIVIPLQFVANAIPEGYV
jgi:hypothetical protein